MVGTRVLESLKDINRRKVFPPRASGVRRGGGCSARAVRAHPGAKVHCTLRYYTTGHAIFYLSLSLPYSALRPYGAVRQLTALG